MQQSSKKSERKERGHEGKNPKQNLTSAKDPTYTTIINKQIA